MERINTNGLYRLGSLLRETYLMARQPLRDWTRVALEARSYIVSALDPEGALVLKLSRPAALGLDKCLYDAIQLHLDKKQEKLTDAQVDIFNTAYFTFNNALGLELGQAPIFFVTPKGVYDTDTLISNGSAVYGELKDVMPGDAIEDTDAAGRCLAFTLPTAAGFHVARALESIARTWLVEAVKASQGEVDNTKGWGDLYNLMGKHKATKKLTKHFDQIRDIDRNPLIHPEETLDQIDAQQLWSICTSLGLAMAREIQAAQQATPLVGP